MPDNEVPHDEYSSGGSRLLRHGAGRGFEWGGPGDPDRIEAIAEHIGRWVGEVTSVNADLVSNLLHLDIAIVPPSGERPFHTLVTMGMSEHPMAMPDEVRRDGGVERAELVMLLPADWPIEDREHWWPLELLRFVARIPREHDTWLGLWHTIPNGNPPLPFVPGTQLAGVLVAPPVCLPDEFATLQRADGEKIEFLAVVGVTAEELKLKLRKGVDSLLDLMDEGGVSELLDPGRASLVRPPWWRRRR